MSSARPTFQEDTPLAGGLTLIEASAGTGKTHTITTLALRLVVEDGVPITQVLVVTFTEAATAELRDRIRTRLRTAVLAYQDASLVLDAFVLGLVERSKQAGTEERDLARLQVALTTFDQATISTIHGFCRRMLQENAFESQVRFDAQLVTELDPLIEEVAGDFWTSRMWSQDPDLFRYLSDEAPTHLRGSPRILRGLTKSGGALRGARVLPAPPAPVEPVSRPRWEAAIAQASATWAVEGAAVRGALDEGFAAKVFKKAYTLKGVESACAAIAAWGADPPPLSCDALGKVSLLSASAVTKGVLKKHQRSAPEFDLFQSVERLVELQEAHVLWLQSQALQINLEAFESAAGQLEERKRRLGVQSFDDLLHNLRDALERTGDEGPLASAIRERYRAALIDEFQDTDPIQYDIFRSVFQREGWSAYLIGDPKQAIYSFRGADIYAYIRAADDASEHAFTLGTNWRSDAAQVKAIEALFRRHAAPFVDEAIQFVEVGAHHAETRLKTAAGLAPLRIRLMAPGSKVSKSSGSGRRTKEDMAERLPRVVVDDVVDLLDPATKAMIDGRPVAPGDIAILTRTNPQAEALQRELRRRGIPSVRQGSASVFDSDDARELRHVLSAVLTPNRPTALRTALATDLLGQNAITLARFVGDRAGPQLQGDEGPGDEGLDDRDLGDIQGAEDQEPWDEVVEAFCSLRETWEERGFMRMFRRLIEERGVQGRLLAAVGGERRMTNVLHLSELLHRAASQERLTPPGLLEWFQKQIEGGDANDRDSIQLRLESDESAVKLVTIHKSKGMEYPIVLCPYLWDGALLRGEGKTFFRFHDPDFSHDLTLDLGSDQSERAIYTDHDPRARSKQLAEGEVQTEALRLLYVALTRAKHHTSVYFGPVNGMETSPLGYLLLGAEVGTGGLAGLAAARMRIKKLEPDEIQDELEEFAAASSGLISVEPIVFGPRREWAGLCVEAPPLQARQAKLVFDRDWRSTSYSGLTSHSKGGAVDTELDRDGVEGEARVSLPVEADEDPVPLRGFPRGARAGHFFHKVLELADFGALGRANHTNLVREQLGAYDFDVERWTRLVQPTLARALETPLEPGPNPLRLVDLPPERRLDELGFVFPIQGGLGAGAGKVTAAGLAGVLREHATSQVSAGYPDRVERLDFKPLQGFLAGFVDLIFEHGKKWYVVDYKSNHLGDVFSDYSQARLQEAMAEHHYYLQYHLYTVALHRYLSWRLPGYDYQRHFGGVYYLFLRGMHPDAGWERGVFRDRPSRALVGALDRLLGGGA
jgi:exodeoxyribonuclease V beta subunit